jgi:hypothetical protein
MIDQRPPVAANFDTRFLHTRHAQSHRIFYL